MKKISFWVDFIYFESLSWKWQSSISRNVKSCFREVIFPGQNLKTFFWEEFWELRLKCAGFHFQKYEKKFLLRSYQKKFPARKYKKSFSLIKQKSFFIFKLQSLIFENIRNFFGMQLFYFWGRRGVQRGGCRSFGWELR